VVFLRYDDGDGFMWVRVGCSSLTRSVSRIACR